jgi:hypothetical protein
MQSDIQLKSLYTAQDYMKDAIKVGLRYKYQGQNWSAVVVIHSEVLYKCHGDDAYEMAVTMLMKQLNNTHGFLSEEYYSIREALFKMLKGVSGPTLNSSWADGGVVNSAPKAQGINGVPVNEVANKLPGMNTKVDCPNDNCFDSITKETYYSARLYGMIQHLNDHHKWTREKIADWLDELHDAGTINIEFDSEPIKIEQKEYRESYKSYIAPVGNGPMQISYQSKLDITWEEIGYTTENFPYSIKKETPND